MGFGRLFSYAGKYRRNILLNIIANLLMALFTVVSVPAIIPFLQILFDKNIPDVARPESLASLGDLAQWGQYQVASMIQAYGKEQTLIMICGFILVLFFFKNLFRYLSLFFMAPVRNGIVRDMRQQLFAKMLGLPLGYFSEERKGDLLARITSDVQEVEWGILNVLEAIVREPLIIFGCLGYMLYVSPPLTFFVLVLLIVTGLLIGGIGSALRRPSARLQEKLGMLLSVVEESLSGLPVIKRFNADIFQQKKFQSINNAYRNLHTQILWRRDLASPLSEFLGIAVVTVLLWYGSRLVFGGEMEAATFFSFLFAFFNVINPAKSFSSAYYNTQKARAALDRIESVLGADEQIRDHVDAQTIDHLEKGIEFKNISFTYNSVEGPVLKQINFSIDKGKVVALVGVSGSGKSTIASLLSRFYEVEEGQILIDGIEIRQLKIRALRDLMGVVSQEAILFNDTVYNNIVFGAENIAREEVEAAARIANADEFINKLEQGYDSLVGDRGSKLSGGQRQRITIARAILRNPPILILDEATSALDAESERLVQEAMDRVLKDRTAIIIAHRLSTIQHADEILVMKNGAIIEKGSHQDLMNLSGEYRKLVELQAF